MYFNSSLAYGLARYFKIPYNIASPAALIGTSNFFELAVAVTISLFGLKSGATLATVVGVLVEVPVMLSVCIFCNRTRHWFEFTSQPYQEKKGLNRFSRARRKYKYRYSKGVGKLDFKEKLISRSKGYPGNDVLKKEDY